MGILTRIRSIYVQKDSRSDVPNSSDSSKRLAELSDALTDLRGDRVSAQSPKHGMSTSAVENVAAAAKDYGLSRFSGETDAMGAAAKSYRPAKTRRQRKLDG